MSVEFNPAEHFRLCEDVPTEEEIDLAAEMQQETDWQDYAETILAPEELKKEKWNGLQKDGDTLL